MKIDDTLITTYLPVAVLIAFALLQIDRADRNDQPPWQGGGFGMFSSNDRASLRELRAVALRGDEEIRLLWNPQLRSVERRVVALPTEANLLSFGALASEHVDVEGLDGVRVEVWRTEFDASTSTARLVKLREATLWRGDPP